MRDMTIDIPSDRDGDFEPQVVKKYQADISTIEDQVLSMYVKGMTTRDITEHLQNIYGVDAEYSDDAGFKRKFPFLQILLKRFQK